MAIEDTIQISDGTTDIDLIMDTNGFEMLASGGDFGISNHDNLYHKSDWLDGEMLVREKTENKTWSFKLAVRGTTDDAIINTIKEFNKMSRQARQYHISRDVAKVYLYIKLAGATHATYYDIIDIQAKGLGLLDYMNRNMGEVVFGDGLSVDIITEPFGYGDVQILENELPNPHFEEDSNSDGDPDFWTVTGSPATGERVTSLSRVGSASVYILGTGGLNSDTLTPDTLSMSVVGYAYIYISTYADSVQVGLYNVTDSSYIDTENADTGIVDSWQKVSVAGTLPSYKTISLRIEAVNGEVKIDQTYLQFSDTEPIGWMSYKQLINHHDDDEGDINYIDVADIGGDVEAKTRITLITNTGANVGAPTIWMGKRTKGNIYHRLTLDSTEEDSTPTSTTADGDYSFGEYSNYTLTSLSAWSSFIYWDFPNGTDALDFNGKFMLLLVGDSFDSDVYFKAQYVFSLTAMAETEPVLGSGKDILELGILDLPPGFKDVSGVVYAHKIRVQAYNGTGSSAGCAVDYLLMMPLSNYRILKQQGYLLIDGTGVADDGIVMGDIYGLNAPGDTYRDASIYYGLGEQIVLDPMKSERLTFLWLGFGASSSAYNPQQSHYVRIDYLPRTEFLIGT